jgi:hypothetical protein
MPGSISPLKRSPGGT